MSVWSARRKLRKWLEIVCDLAQPRKREHFAARISGQVIITLQQWEVILRLWTPVLFYQWLTINTMPESADKWQAIGELWDAEIINVPGWADDLGRDVTGQVPLYESAPWTDSDRRLLVLVTNDDCTSLQIEAFSEGIESDVTDQMQLRRPRYRLDWETRLGLSERTLGDIRNFDAIVHPRFDRPVAVGLFTEDTLPAEVVG